MVADYNGTGVGGHTASTTPTVYTANNGGTGVCTATGGGVPADDLTADFSSVTPDSANATDCLYKNAVLAKVISSDTSSWNVAVSGTVPAAQGVLCILANGGAAYSNNEAIATSGRVAAVAAISTAAQCTSASGFPIIPGGTTLLTVAGASTNATYLGGDIELGLLPNAGSGANSVVVTYTLTMN
jgi:hypothetical protein